MTVHTFESIGAKTIASWRMVHLMLVSRPKWRMLNLIVLLYMQTIVMVAMISVILGGRVIYWCTVLFIGNAIRINSAVIVSIGVMEYQYSDSDCVRFQIPQGDALIKLIVWCITLRCVFSIYPLAGS